MGIRAKLLIFLIIIIVLPLGIMFGTLILGFTNIADKTDGIDVKTEYINQYIIAEIRDNFSYIDDYETFYNKINPLITEYRINLQIFSLSSRLIFDSQRNELSSSGESLINNVSYRFSSPIFIKGEKAATAVIKTNNQTIAPYNTINQAYFLIILSIILGIAVLIILMLLFTLYISNTIIKPLKNLNIAAENIATGNLDYELKHKREDEIARFTKTFNMMRVKLKESLEKQQFYEQSRKELIASISHDLRTPISSIKGYVEGLQDGLATDEKTFERYLTVIKNKTNQLDRLINDLFNYSQIEMDKLEVNLIEVNSKKFLKEIYNNIETEMGMSKIQLEIKLPIPSVPIKVDKSRIEQVFDNLIGNAKRFVGEGGLIVIETFIQKNDLVVSIKDNGLGIKEEDITQIFESFFRGEKSRSREYGGIGLGLAICKTIIDLHGGKIWVDSNKGVGSTFYFSLPIK